MNQPEARQQASREARQRDRKRRAAAAAAQAARAAAAEEKRRAERAERRRDREARIAEGRKLAGLAPEQRIAAAAEARERRRARMQAAGPGLPVRAPDWTTVPRGDGFCSPATARCADARDHKRIRRPCCSAMNRELLRFVVDLLNSMGVTWWADYGTLLGAVRHGGMIPWDKDNDLGILQSNKRKILALEPMLRRAGIGFAGRRMGTVKFYASRTNKTNTDVFAWERNPRGLMTRKTYAGVDKFKGREFPAEWLLPLTTVEYDGMILNAPAAVRMPGATPAPNVPGFEAGSLFLEHRYGPGWMHPIRANNDGVRR